MNSVKLFSASLFLVGLFLGSSVVIGQETLYEFQTRTHMVSPEELGLKDDIGKGFVATPPPGGKVRSIAEFEHNEGVIVAYSGQFGIPFNLIASMAQVAKIYTVVANASVENTVRNLYIANGVDITKCVFVHGPLNSYWARDFSPWFIADSANRVAIVDFPYNRPRPNDDGVPGLFANALGVSIYGMNVKHTGGNYMSNGLGVAACTKLVLTENSNLSATQIDGYMHDYLGIDQHYTLEDPLGDYIEHIDCWGKFLAPDKFLLGQVPSNDPRFQDYEAIAAFFAAEISSYGTPYKVYRVYSPNGQPYTNSFILNQKVFVPVVTTNGTPWNDSAIAVYQRAMPGYTIEGIFGLSSKPWASTDALHCRVHEIPDRGMLYLKHIPLHGDVGQKSSYEIRAEIIPYSDSLVIADSVVVNYRYGNGSWHQTVMMPDTGFVWSGAIPDSAAGVNIEYTIHAADYSGRVANHPYIGTADPHTFFVKSTIGIRSSVPSQRDILVFPNPCDDRIFAAIPDPGEQEVLVRIYGLRGELLVSQRFSNAKELYKHGLNTSQLNNGVYLMEVLSGQRKYMKQVMVIHP